MKAETISCQRLASQALAEGLAQTVCPSGWKILALDLDCIQWSLRLELIRVAATNGHKLLITLEVNDGVATLTRDSLVQGNVPFGGRRRFRVDVSRHTTMDDALSRLNVLLEDLQPRLTNDSLFT